MKIKQLLKKFVYFEEEEEEYDDVCSETFRAICFPLFNRKLMWIKHSRLSRYKFFWTR